MKRRAGGDGGLASRAQAALLARYAELDAERLPEKAQFSILQTETETLVLVSLPETDPLVGARAALPQLTAAELSVLRYVLVGHSDDAIARARKRSVRTIGHQIASIYRKVGVSSRRELLAALRAPSDTANPPPKRGRRAHDP